MRLPFWFTWILIYLTTVCQCKGDEGFTGESLTSLSDANPDWEEWDTEVRLSKRQATDQTETSASAADFTGDPQIFRLKFCLTTQCTDDISANKDEPLKSAIFQTIQKLLDGTLRRPFQTFIDSVPVRVATSCSIPSGEVEAVVIILFLNGTQVSLSQLEQTFQFSLIDENDNFKAFPIGGLAQCGVLKLENATTNYNKINFNSDELACNSDKKSVTINELPLAEDIGGTTLSSPSKEGTSCELSIKDGKVSGTLTFDDCNFRTVTSDWTTGGQTITHFARRLYSTDGDGWIHLFCYYLKRKEDDLVIGTYTSSSDNSQMVRRRDVGTFNIKFGLYSDSLYMDEISKEKPGSMTDYMYGQIYLLGLDMDTNNMGVTVENCATSSEDLLNITDTSNHILVENRCPIDQMYESIPTRQSDMFKFRFKPTLATEETNRPLYMHCDVRICYHDDPDNACEDPSEYLCRSVKKREAHSTHSVPLLYGPLHFSKSISKDRNKRQTKKIISTDNDSRTMDLSASTYMLLTVIIVFIVINVSMASVHLYLARARNGQE